MIYVLKTLHFGTKYVTISALSIQVFFAYTVNDEELNQLRRVLYSVTKNDDRITLLELFQLLEIYSVDNMFHKSKELCTPFQRSIVRYLIVRYFNC